MTVLPVDKSDPYRRGVVADGRKRHDWLELLVAYGLILLAIWTPLPWQRVISLVALGWVLLATKVSFGGWSAMGLGSTGFWPSLWVVAAALLIAAASVTLARGLQTLHAPLSLSLFVKRFWGYVLWAFLQEFLLLDFFLMRLQRLFSGRKSAVIAAVGMFTIAHLPNPILTALTLLWSWVACRIFLRYRNVYTLAMAHAIFGICIAVSIPSPVVHTMRVGLGYFRH